MTTTPDVTAASDSHPTRGARFLRAVEAIKESLAKQYNERFTGMGTAIQHADQHRNPVVMHNRKILKLAAELRNAIQHGDVESGSPVADPRESLVNAIEKISEQLARPPKIGDHGAMPQVLSPEDPLQHVTELIVRHDLSQLPVYDGREFRGMLTTNALARWLSRSIEPESGDLIVGEVRVKDVLGNEEPYERPKFFKPTASAWTVCDALSKSDGPIAVLVTTDGTKKGQLQKIVTRFDVPIIQRWLTVAAA